MLRSEQRTFPHPAEDERYGASVHSMEQKDGESKSAKTAPATLLSSILPRTDGGTPARPELIHHSVGLH